MFPHVVTVYNVQQSTDAGTFEDTESKCITVLRGVFMEASKAVNVRESGLEGADAVNLYIPFSVSAVDGESGEGKTYTGPLAFWEAADKAGLWTLSTNGNGGMTYFVKGEVVEPGMTWAQIEAKYDDVYTVTKVDMKDFGDDMAHWEVGGA